MADEVRTVNQITGGEKGRKLARFDLVPVSPLTQLAEHYGKGAAKYADRNWERGTDWSLNYAALMRHVTQWWNGEDIDEETGSHHLTAVAWHAFALLQFAETHPELDDRPNGEQHETLEQAMEQAIYAASYGPHTHDPAILCGDRACVRCSNWRLVNRMPED